MKFTFLGNYPTPRNERCWKAIEGTIDEWISATNGASLHGRFLPEEESLQLELIAPGSKPKIRGIDVSWIAYGDQAEHLALQTELALVDLDTAGREQGRECNAR